MISGGLHAKLRALEVRAVAVAIWLRLLGWRVDALLSLILVGTRVHVLDVVLAQVVHPLRYLVERRRLPVFVQRIGHTATFELVEVLHGGCH